MLKSMKKTIINTETKNYHHINLSDLMGVTTNKVLISHNSKEII